MITSEIWFILVAAIGVLVRVALPYLKHKAEANKKSEEFVFDTKFAWTALYSVVMMVIELAAVLAENPNLLVNLPVRFAIIGGFFFGLGNTELMNRILG